jgi:hypothetical protein
MDMWANYKKYIWPELEIILKSSLTNLIFHPKFVCAQFLPHLKWDFHWSIHACLLPYADLHIIAKDWTESVENG